MAHRPVGQAARSADLVVADFCEGGAEHVVAVPAPVNGLPQLRFDHGRTVELFRFPPGSALCA